MAKKTAAEIKRMKQPQIVRWAVVAIVTILAIGAAWVAIDVLAHKRAGQLSDKWMAEHARQGDGNSEKVHRSITSGTSSGGEYSLGSLGFRIVNDKATPRKDAATDGIRAFLQKEVDSSGCPNNNAVFSVTAYSPDETQLLLGYGCGGASGLMYAIKKNGAWQTISPTNKFNELSVPSCQMVNENDIHKDIAPVCYTLPDGDQGSRYHYSLR